MNEYKNFKPQYIFVNANNEVVIKKDIFEKMIAEAWGEGYSEGLQICTRSTLQSSPNLHLNTVPYYTNKTDSIIGTNHKNSENFTEYSFMKEDNIDNQSNKLYESN